MFFITGAQKIRGMFQKPFDFLFFRFSALAFDCLVSTNQIRQQKTCRAKAAFKRIRLIKGTIPVLDARCEKKTGDDCLPDHFRIILAFIIPHVPCEIGQVSLISCLRKIGQLPTPITAVKAAVG